MVTNIRGCTKITGSPIICSLAQNDKIEVSCHWLFMAGFTGDIQIVNGMFGSDVIAKVHIDERGNATVLQPNVDMEVVEDLERQIAELQGQLEFANEEYRDNQHEIAHLNIRIAGLEADLDGAIEEINDAEEVIRENKLGLRTPPRFIADTCNCYECQQLRNDNPKDYTENNPYHFLYTETNPPKGKGTPWNMEKRGNKIPKPW